MRTITRRVMLAASAAFAAAPAFGQSSTTTLVVPFPPGGSTDALARVLQAAMQAKLNRTVIVELAFARVACYWPPRARAWNGKC